MVTFGLKLTCPHQPSETSSGIFFISNSCHGNCKNPIFLVSMVIMTRKIFLCLFHKTKYSKHQLKKLGLIEEYFSIKNVANCQIWYFDKSQVNLRGSMDISVSKIWQKIFRKNTCLLWSIYLYKSKKSKIFESIKSFFMC